MWMLTFELPEHTVTVNGNGRIRADGHSQAGAQFN